MPTPSDSGAPTSFVPSSYLEHSSHTTCPPENTDWRIGYDELSEREIDPLARPAPRDLEGPTQQDEAESSTPMDLTTNEPLPPKMPTAAADNEDWLSSSSADLSEASSGDSAATERPNRADQSQSPMPMQQEITSYTDSTDISYGLPRV